MSTELLERQQASAPTVEGITLPRTDRGPRWWLVLAVVTAVAVTVGGGILVLTQEESPGTFPSLNTATREGSGFAPVEVHEGFPELDTAIREGSGYQQVAVTTGSPGLNTAIREGGPYGTVRFADAPGRGHVIPRPDFDPSDHADYAGTGHVPPA